MHEAVGLYRVLSVLVNMLRSLPFIILLIVLIGALGYLLDGLARWLHARWTHG